MVKRGCFIIKIEQICNKLIIILHYSLFGIKMPLENIKDSIKKDQNSPWGVDESFLVG